MSTIKVVVTGGPSTGKTSVINQLEKNGYHCLHEVIRLMTKKKEEEGETVFKSNPIVSVSNPKAFNQKILNARIEQYLSVKNSNHGQIFFDRGIPDVLAYMDCFNQAYDSSFKKACETYTYNVVFIMPPWKEIFTSDGQRFESYEENVQIHQCLLQCYSRFGYTIQVVPKMGVEERMNFMLDYIRQLG